MFFPLHSLGVVAPMGTREVPVKGLKQPASSLLKVADPQQGKRPSLI